VMQPETIAAARTLSSDGIDAFIKRRGRWAQGFQLGGPNEARDLTRLMGATSSADSFAHAGNASCGTLPAISLSCICPISSTASTGELRISARSATPPLRRSDDIVRTRPPKAADFAIDSASCA
jgi:hypothetical protein